MSNILVYIPKIALYFRHHVYSFVYGRFSLTIAFLLSYIFFSYLIFFFLFISFFISIFRFTTNTAVTERQGNSCPMLIFISLFTFTSYSRIRIRIRIIRIRRPANKLSSEPFRNVFLSFHSQSSWFLYTICFGFAFVALAPTDIRTRPSFMNVWRWRPQPCEFYLAAVGCAAQWNPSQWSGSPNLQVYFSAGDKLTLISGSIKKF